MDHLALRLIYAYERVLDLQSSVIKRLNPNEYAAEMERAITPVYQSYRNIMQQGDFLMNLARGTARGDVYKNAGRYYLPKIIMNTFDDIEEYYRIAMSSDDPMIQSLNFIFALDTITDSIHGSLMITTQIAKIQPIRDDIGKDARFLSIMASHFIGSAEIVMSFALKNARKAFHRYASTGKIWDDSG